jgi:hypothetical protein
MLARLIPSCLILICLISIGASNSCRKGNNMAQPQDKDKTVNLGQDVTNDRKPKDPIFIDFENNWRKFISPLPELALPVTPMREGVPREEWQPVIQSECVFSPDAGGYVPQVTLSWNESAGQAPAPAVSQTQQERPPGPSASDRIRFDLTVQYKGFDRNFYSSILSTEKDKRFNLPSNSTYVSQPEAMMLTGPSLFPKLMDYRTETFQDRETRREIKKRTLVLRDLSPGLSYTIRLSAPGDSRWDEQKKFVFLTPVCPKEF